MINPDDSIKLKELDPEARAYELQPGRAYVIEVETGDLDNPEKHLARLRTCLVKMGITNVVVIDTAWKMRIFALETSTGAAVVEGPYAT